MRNSEAFIFGTIIGAAVVWLWGRAIGDYLGEQTRGVRATAADGLQALEEKAGQLLDGGGHSLRRAEDFLEDAKEQVGGALRAGREAIRPASRAGGAGPRGE